MILICVFFTNPLHTFCSRPNKIQRDDQRTLVHDISVYHTNHIIIFYLRLPVLVVGLDSPLLI